MFWNICSKANQKLSALSRMVKLLSFSKRRTLFKAFVGSQFKYCLIVWMLHSWRQNQNVVWRRLNYWLMTCYPVNIGRKLNVHKTFRRRPGRVLNVLCTFNLRPVSVGYGQIFLYSPLKYSETLNWNLYVSSLYFLDQFERVICRKRKYRKLAV